MFQRTEKGAKFPHHPCGLGHLETSEHLCVFEGARPCISVVLQVVANESSLWCFAGSNELFGSTIGRASENDLKLWMLPVGNTIELISFTCGMT
jgi:hypothetical protein